MSAVDDRIVSMKFDNKKFEQNASQTMSTLDKLKQKLGFAGATKGLQDVSAAAGKVNLNPLSNGLDGVSTKFLALGTIAVTALSRLTNSVLDSASAFAKQFSSIQAAQDGFSEYELKMGSIQTIMAGTGASLEEVNGYLDELNTYADRTIYSFADMTSNIGKFTNAGVGLDVAVKAIQGISNVAAVSGANANEASRAMYNFSQALSAGHVKLIDWKSIEYANMATAEFKEQLLEGAVAAGTLTKGVDGMYTTLKGTPVSATKGFNESLEQQWLTTEVLTSTLGKYADETTEIGKKAFASAQDIKTLTQMLDTVKEAAGSGWARTFEILIGDFNEAKALWTGVGGFLSDYVNATAEARNNTLQDWKDLGGRTSLIEGFKNILEAFANVLTPIREAWREIFPPKTGQDLYNITEAFRKFTERLIIGEKTMDGIKRTFSGVFSVLSIAKQVISAVVGAVFSLFGAFSGGQGSIWNFTGSIGEMITAIDAWLKKGDKLQAFFGGIARVLSMLISPIVAVMGAIFDVAAVLISSGLDVFIAGLGAAFGGIESPISGIGDAFNFVASAIEGAIAEFKNFLSIGSAGTMGGVSGPGSGVTDAWENVKSIFSGVGTFFVGLWNGLKATIPAIGNLLGYLGDRWAEFFKNGQFDLQDFLSILNTGVFMYLGWTLSDLVNTIKEFTSNFSGVFDSASGVFDQLTSNLKTMQNEVRSRMVLNIAIAVGVLAASLWVLSNIPQAKLATGLGAIAVLLTELVIAMSVLMKTFETDVFDKKGVLKIAAMVAVMTALGVAMLAMAVAVAIFAMINPKRLATGLAGFSAVLIEMIAALTLISKIDFEPKKVLAFSGAVAILAGAMIVLAAAIGLFVLLGPENIAMGLGVMAVALGGFIVALRLLPEEGEMLKAAAAIAVLSVAMLAMAGALKILGSMGLMDSVQALAALGAAMFMIKVALDSLSDAKNVVPTASAFLIMATAIGILAPALSLLGKVPLKNIAKALGTVAAAFVILGVAAYILGPMSTVVLVLAAAIAVLGVGFMAVGAGMALFAAGIASLAVAGTAGFTVLTAGILIFLSQLPLMIKEFSKSVGALIQLVIANTPLFFDALVGMVREAITAMRELLPDFAALATDIVQTLASWLKENGPTIIDAAFTLLMDFLDALEENGYEIASTAINIVLQLVKALGDNAPRIASAAWKMAIRFVQAIGSSFEHYAPQFMQAGQEAALAIGRGMLKGLTGSIFLGPIPAAIKAIAGRGKVALALGLRGMGAPSRLFMEEARKIPLGIAVGIEKNTYLAEDAAFGMAQTTLNATKGAIAKINNAITGELNLDPVIAPVLDLTKVKSEMGAMDHLMSTHPLATNSYSNAQSVLAERQAAAQAMALLEEERLRPEQKIEFNQYNNSPKSLSAIDIYRQTKNQLSAAKGALEPNA